MKTLKGWNKFLLLTLILGAFLRLLWGSDIEYKGDEQFMFERTQKVGIVEPLPWLGMTSGVGTRNPAVSIWVFLGLSRIFFTDSPPELARSVEILNILALVGLVLFALKYVEKKHRDEWLWAASLASVNPLAILLQRKIWAQSVLPLFCMLLILGWWRRDRVWGAFLWGFIGVLVGQIHMSGFFLMGALFIWNIAFGQKLKVKRKTHWMAFAGGCALGGLPLIPWLYYVFITPGSGSSFLSYLTGLDYKPLLTSLFWQLWATNPTGLGLWYSLGANEFREFLNYPLIMGHPTYVIGLTHFMIFAALMWTLFQTSTKLWSSSTRWKELVIGSGSETDFLKSSALWGYGIILTLLGVMIYRHYLLITFPLEFLWLAQLVLRNTKKPVPILGLIWACQLIISISFLSYIHVNHGAPTGDYGVGYQFQR